MAIDALVRPLLAVPLFHGLSPLQITEIARRAERVVYRPGDLVIEEDREGDAAVLIVSGPCVRVSGPEMAAAAEPVPQGALLGEMAMLIETVHTSTVVARGPVRALRLVRSEMHTQMREDSSLAHHFEQKITNRLVGLAAELKKIDRLLSGTFASHAMSAAGARLTDGPQIPVH